MKLTSLVWVGVGYVLGARAGRERYEQIVRVSRRVAGSQTVQATAGVVQAQLDQLVGQARQSVHQTLGGNPAGSAGVNGSANGSRDGANGYHR